METNMNRSGERQALSFLGGIVFGCLTAVLLGMCILGSMAFLVLRPDSAGAGIARTSDNPIENGRQIFQNRCTHCHSTGTEVKVGPGLAGLFSPGGPALPGGIEYEGGLPNGKEISEANVAEWIREGGSGLIGTMPGQFLSDTQLADLIAYLKTLKR
jgi:cytochrome c